MSSSFDLIKKTARVRLKNKDGEWGEAKEFEYYAEEKKPVTKKQVVVSAQRKQGTMQSIFNWLGMIITGPRYTISSNKGYTFRLDTHTGETWYCDNINRDNLNGYVVSSRPKWVKIKESK